MDLRHGSNFWKIMRPSATRKGVASRIPPTTANCPIAISLAEIRNNGVSGPAAFTPLNASFLQMPNAGWPAA